jgi:SET and MYND domain-containing protein 4
MFIGGGLYPTLALLNHSCDPGIVRYYKGNVVHVHVVKTIHPGEEISENYGPIFTMKKREDRQFTLKDQYKFDCRCPACTNNWPLYKEMDAGVMRFR